MKQQKFAVFDIDGTIARDSIFLAVVDELVKRNRLASNAGAELAKKFEEYRKRTSKDVFNEYAQLSVETLFSKLTTLSVADYQAAVDHVLESHKYYSYVYTRNLIGELKDEGYFLIALSGSEMYSVIKFGEHYGFDVCVGETYEEINGYFTGKIDKVIHVKDKHLKRLIKEHALTTKGSIGIGDSLGDLEMLELVENPIAFNPESRLYELAKTRGWKIVIERKNVIYELEQTPDNDYRLISNN